MTKGPTNSYRPRPGTPLGDAYALVIDEIRGIAEPEEVQFLQANPILWVRAMRLHAKNLEHRMTAAGDKVAALKPEPGDNPAVEYLRARKAYRQKRNGWQHQLRVMKVRLEEIAMSAGYRSVYEMDAIGDVAVAFGEIYAAARQDDLNAVEDIAKLWADRLFSLKARAEPGQDVPA